MTVGRRNALGFDIVVDVERAVISTFLGVADPPGFISGQLAPDRMNSQK
jgi:hypothetical protein